MLTHLMRETDDVFYASLFIVYNYIRLYYNLT